MRRLARLKGEITNKHRAAAAAAAGWDRHDRQEVVRLFMLMSALGRNAGDGQTSQCFFPSKQASKTAWRQKRAQQFIENFGRCFGRCMEETPPSVTAVRALIDPNKSRKRFMLRWTPHQQRRTNVALTLFYRSHETRPSPKSKSRTENWH